MEIFGYTVVKSRELWVKAYEDEYAHKEQVDALKKSKSLEKEIDDEIERVNQIISKPKVIQGTLFDN